MAFGAASTRNILNLSLLAAFLFATFSEHVKSTSSKSFRRATNRNRTDLCPSGQTDAPYASIEVDMLYLPKVNTDCPSPYALCSWKCALEPNCMSFVWHANTKLCEFFSSVPQTCSAISDCIHFEVSGLKFLLKLISYSNT